MKAFVVETLIKASPHKVWDVLTEIEAWPSWDSGVLEVKGKAAKGEKLKLVSEANPKRAFSLKVSSFHPPSSMVWAGGMPFGLFKGVRSFNLKPEGTATRVHVEEVYSGPLLPLIWRSMPDLQPSFDKFAMGLKKHVESAV